LINYNKVIKDVEIYKYIHSKIKCKFYCIKCFDFTEDGLKWLFSQKCKNIQYYITEIYIKCDLELIKWIIEKYPKVLSYYMNFELIHDVHKVKYLINFYKIQPDTLINIIKMHKIDNNSLFELIKIYRKMNIKYGSSGGYIYLFSRYYTSGI
jgi:hypothetical protein